MTSTKKVEKAAKEKPKQPVNESVAYSFIQRLLARMFHSVQLKISHVIIRNHVMKIKGR